MLFHVDAAETSAARGRLRRCDRLIRDDQKSFEPLSTTKRDDERLKHDCDDSR
jgi:hypothetical protein